MRTIDAPGVEITETDKSQYLPSMTGTSWLIPGFANKSQAYISQQFTSRSSWLNNFGEPETEAERYFYNASMEAINQKAQVYCCRLPYDNASKDKMVGMKYKVDASIGSISSTSDYLSSQLSCGLSSDKAFLKTEWKWFLDNYCNDIAVKNLIKTYLDDSDLSSKYIETMSAKFYDSPLSYILFPKEDSSISANLKTISSENEYYSTIFNRLGDNNYLLSSSASLSSLYMKDSKDISNDVQNSVLDYLKLNESILTAYSSLLPTLSILSSNLSTNACYRYRAIKNADPSIDSYLSISGEEAPSLYDIADIDSYRTGENRVPANSFIIFDKTCSQYQSIEEDNSRKGTKLEMIGIVPVVTTAANAMYVQSIINVKSSEVSNYETVSCITTLNYKNGSPSISSNTILPTDLVSPLNSISGSSNTVSKDAAENFPSIVYREDGSIDREHLKKIGVIVYKAYLDSTEGNKISLSPVEAFVGSLDRTAVNPTTKVTTFIDTIINSQSKYIEFYSNCYSTDSSRKTYETSADILIMPATTAGSLGFYSSMCEKNISLSMSIYDSLNKIFDKNSDINEKDLDLIVDAGVSNIAQYIASVYGTSGKGKYNPSSEEAAMWKLNKSSDTSVWKSVIQKYDNFCKSTRKDCMFIADGLRPLVLQGEKKIVRYSKPNNTIDENILPYVKYLTGINTSYGAGYLDWFQKSDEFTGDFFWCPPSIQAAGIYTYTDTYFNYWDAPAGLNRGIVYSAVDVAFSPTNKQAGSIYTKNWNYAINYPQDGIVLGGQKTFQVKPSAFDRVNVRRLFLRLERSTFKAARYFVYEGNTAYTRQRLIDAITPMFESAKIGGGIYDYKIIADETINTAAVIDNNEIRCKIGIKPVKTAEYILIDFVALSTGGSFDEM